MLRIHFMLLIKVSVLASAFQIAQFALLPIHQ
jgi:hypothetical protein